MPCNASKVPYRHSLLASVWVLRGPVAGAVASSSGGKRRRSGPARVTGRTARALTGQLLEGWAWTEYPAGLPGLHGEAPLHFYYLRLLKVLRSYHATLATAGQLDAFLDSMVDADLASQAKEMNLSETAAAAAAAAADAAAGAAAAAVQAIVVCLGCWFF